MIPLYFVNVLTQSQVCGHYTIHRASCHCRSCHGTFFESYETIETAHIALALSQWQFNGVRALMKKKLFVIIPTICVAAFKCTFCEAYVVFSIGVVVRCDVGFVDQACRETFITQGAIRFCPAVAFIFLGSLGGVENVFVVAADNRFHIFHAAIAYFDCVLVENFGVAVRFWEVFLDQGQKFSCDVGLDVLTEGRVKPYCFPVSVLVGVSYGCFVVAEFQFGVVSACFQRRFVQRSCIIEYFSIA